jgi:hypothetical protein
VIPDDFIDRPPDERASILFPKDEKLRGVYLEGVGAFLGRNTKNPYLDPNGRESKADHYWEYAAWTWGYTQEALRNTNPTGRLW